VVKTQYKIKLRPKENELRATIDFSPQVHLTHGKLDNCNRPTVFIN